MEELEDGTEDVEVLGGSRVSRSACAAREEVDGTGSRAAARGRRCSVAVRAEAMVDDI